MTPDERAALRALAEHRDDMTDRRGQPCYLRVTGTDDAHEWATGRGFQNEPVEVCVHCGSYRYTNEGRRGAYERAAALAAPALLDALDAAEADLRERLAAEVEARAPRWRLPLTDIEAAAIADCARIVRGGK